MAKKTATSYVDYQQRALEFSVGDMASPFMADSSKAGRVVAVYPAIGMVDVVFPHGQGRYAVEDLQKVTGVLSTPPETESASVPGGRETVPVAGTDTSIDRVAHAFVKRAIYWGSKDRKYKARQPELTEGVFYCPRCKDVALRPARYKREQGVSSNLLACSKCLFLIKTCDIIGHADYEADLAEENEAHDVKLARRYFGGRN